MIPTQPVTSSTIRPAEPRDISQIVDLIHGLAAYEKLSHECSITDDQLRQSLFSRSPVAFALVAEKEERLVGFALYYYTYSTFTGKQSLYLEDLYVEPSQRGTGLGKALIRQLVHIALSQNCARVQWWVLNWNQPSIEFYQRLGATPMNDWTVLRLDNDAMQQLVTQDIQ